MWENGWKGCDERVIYMQVEIKKIREIELSTSQVKTREADNERGRQILDRGSVFIFCAKGAP